MNWKKFQLLFILALSLCLVFSCSHNDEEEELDNSGDNASQSGENSGDTLPETTNDEDKTDTASESGDSDALDDTDMPDNDNDPTDDPDALDDADTSDNDNDPTDDPNDSDDMVVSDDDISGNDADTDTDPTDEPDEDQDSASTDPDTDSGDSQPDDDGDTSAPEPTLPECSPASTKPCIDSSTKLIWSSATSQNKKWAEAENRCSGLEEGGFKDWRLPTISELRTLVRNCQKTSTGGACKVTDECTASYSTANPQCYNVDLCTSTTNAIGIEWCGDKTDGSYSLLGDASVYIWSSSVTDEDHDKAWYIYFRNTNILNQKKTLPGMVRCVRRGE